MSSSHTANFGNNLSAFRNFIEEHPAFVRLTGHEAKSSTSGINRTLQES